MRRTVGRTRSRTPRLLAVAVGLVLVVGACGDDGSDASGDTTLPFTSDDLVTEMVDEGFDDDLVQTYVDLLAAGGLAADDAVCVGTAMQDVMEAQEATGTIEPLAPDQLATYEERCGVTADALLGASIGGLVDQYGGTPEQVACGVAAGADADPEVMTDGGGPKLDVILESCNVDPG